jgi:deoxyribodipyrimidine photo-lyase
MAAEKRKLGIMYFRRDLRVYDNTALNKCIDENDYIYPVFIYDARQIEEKKNAYYNDKALSLLRHFVDELCDQFAHFFKSKDSINIYLGDPAHVLKDIVESLRDYQVTIYFNMDFTPFSLQRDTNIFIKLKSVANVKAYQDHILIGVDQLSEITDHKELYIHNPDDIYKKFTPFYNYYSKYKVPEPHTSSKRIAVHTHSKTAKSPKNKYEFLNEYTRLAALKSLKNPTKYHETRDNMFDEKGTFRLSHYLKFGVISIREAYYGFRNLDNAHSRVAAIRQLYWRDFYTLIAWANPKLLGWKFHGFDSKGHPKWEQLNENSALSEKYNKIRWKDDGKIVNAWKSGKTGFPIVDAGMRQLAETGYMHNRARLITASFLTKICGIDWRIGEKWFAQHLIDYDPIINNGNWLWVAGGGADSQPYFRVFNPWLQQKEHDPDCVYIKRWIPELSKIDNKILHKYYLYDTIKGYVAPIIDYATKKEETYRMYIDKIKTDRA